jgi:hypothetical protein
MNNVGTNDVNQGRKAADLERQASNPASRNPQGPVNNAGCVKVNQGKRASEISKGQAQ